MPRQLHSIDRIFLDMETPDNSMGITPLYFYDPSGLANGTFNIEALLEHIDQCVRSIPVLCGKLHRTPLDLDNPYLVEDKNYDVNNHVTHYVLKDSSSIKDLSNAITQYQERTLDTSKPLWDAMVISGINVKTLPKDCFLIALKIHHAVADGMTLMNLTAKLHGQIKIGAPVKLASNSSLLSGGLLGMASRVFANNLKQSIQLVNPLLKIAPRLSVNAINYFFDNLNKSSEPVAQTRFAGNVTPKRVWGYTPLAIDPLNRVRKLLPSCSLNDALLTVIAGGLREYLESKNELPEFAMRAMAPINVRSEGEVGAAGNEISMMSLSLPVEIADPMERLIEVIKFTNNAKDQQLKLGSRNVSELAKNLPAAYLSYMNKIVSSSSANKMVSKLGNTVVTNVPGPKEELNMLGARLINMAGIGPVSDGVGLLHGVMSYNGNMVVNVVSCPSMIPDIKFYIQCIKNSYEKLLAAADARYANLIDEQFSQKLLNETH